MGQIATMESFVNRAQQGVELLYLVTIKHSGVWIRPVFDNGKSCQWSYSVA